MTTPHPQADLLRAIADGKQMQGRVPEDGCDEWLDKELNMAQEIEVLLTKQFDEVQIDQFAIDWLVRQTAEFGEPGRIAERLLGIVSDLLDIDAG